MVDARNHNPIARALVRLGSRAVLTDHDGIFTFPQVTSTSAAFMVVKPGFYQTPDGDPTQSRQFRLPTATPIELPLYPEAILSGSVTNQSGEGLPGLTVTALRSVFDENGHRWANAGQTATHSAGDFRLPLPSGSYMLRINQRGRPGSSQEVVMPLQVPATISSDTQAIKMLPGEESHLDLRADLRHAYTVGLHVDGDGHGFPSITAKTASGGSIPLTPMPSRDQGELRVSLPAGTHTLFASMQTPDGLYEGQAQVTIADHDVTGIVLRLAHAANLPVVVEADSSATLAAGAKLPDANQLGLSFQSTSPNADASDTSNVRVTMRKNNQPSFAMADGVYHLHGQAGGQWYITSATCGGADLLSQGIPVSSGLDGTEIRVRVSNNTATLSGKVTLAGQPGAAWVYLLAVSPSATPVLIFRANSDGSFFRPYLAPGSYRAVSLQTKVNADLQFDAMLSRYLDRVQTFSITPGDQHTLALNAITEQELSP